MSKDAYYFSHDSNAKDDPKCVLLIEQLGLEGYGIYWVLIEILRDQPNYRYPIALIPSIARRYNTTTEKVKAVITGYSLFAVENDEFFYSESLDSRMLSYESKREKARAAIVSRWEREKALPANTDVLRKNYECNTSKVKEKKVKESKTKDLFDVFYAEYPRKVSRADAEKAFRSLAVDDALLSKILNGLSNWKKQDGWKKDGGQFIPYPATWLRQRRWEDELQTAVASHGPIKTAGGTYKI